MPECPHYLEMSLITILGDPAPLEIFECDLPLNHKKKHRNNASGTGVGPRPMDGKARRRVEVLIEWGR